jgi:Wadjet protein JetD, C-terminal
VTGLSPLAAAMAAAVERHRARKVPWRVLAEAAAAVDVSAVGSATWRSRLADAVAELAGSGLASLPSPRARSWDRASSPPVPDWVLSPSPDRPEPTPRVAVVWDAKLAFAARMDADGDLGVGERDLLVAINDWLRDVPDPIVVPVRERSWEVLRDEKVLERTRRGRLFGPGRLTDHLLAIEPAFAPVETSRHGQSPGRVVLVVENWTTYRTLGWVAQRSGWSGTVLWGAGNQVTSRIEAAADVIDQPQQVRYFGDVDVVGLRLARDVTATCETVGWPAPAPAVGLYRLLVSAGGPIPASGRAPRVPGWMEEWLADWFEDAALAAQAVDAAARGRLPQEAVGRVALKDRLLRDLIGR